MTISRPSDISRTSKSSVTVAASFSSKTGAPLGWHVSTGCFSRGYCLGGVFLLFILGVSTQGDAEAQEPAARTARSRLQLALHAQRDPLRDEIREVGRGLSLADTQTGRYGRLYSRRRLCARRGAASRLLLRILVELLQLLATSASPRAKSLIPILVPVQYRLSRYLE
jgi:hypothetical protein